MHAYTLRGYYTTQPIGRNVMRYVAVPFSPRGHRTAEIYRTPAVLTRLSLTTLSDLHPD